MHSFPILVPIDPKLPKAQDKTMQGVGHDINIICKMSSPMSMGNLMRFSPMPTLIFPILRPQDIEYSKPQAQAHSFHGLFGIMEVRALIFLGFCFWFGFEERRRTVM
jgi:hypothetical protein